MENYKDYYSWQEEIEEIRTHISMTRDIIESKRYRGEDVHDLINDIAEYEREIKEIEERNKPNW